MRMRQCHVVSRVSHEDALDVRRAARAFPCSLAAGLSGQLRTVLYYLTLQSTRSALSSATAGGGNEKRTSSSPPCGTTASPLASVALLLVALMTLTVHLHVVLPWVAMLAMTTLTAE